MSQKDKFVENHSLSITGVVNVEDGVIEMTEMPNQSFEDIFKRFNGDYVTITVKRTIELVGDGK